MLRSSLAVLLLWALCFTPGWARDLLIPLDDRPANRLFVEQIVRIGRPQEPLLLPPRHLLGRLLTPGDCARLAEWARSQSGAGDTAVVAADMWLYGGLVASRSRATGLEQLEQRMQELRDLARSGVEVHLVATVPRLSLRTSDLQAPHERTLANWAARADLPSVREMLEQPDRAPFPEGVPVPVVLEYLEVRDRNVEALLQLIDDTADGVFASLVLGQDDAHKTGLHQEEQARLRQRIARRPQAIRLLSGIDELTMNVSAGLLARRAGRAPTVRVIYSHPEAAQMIPPLESLTLGEMVSDHLELSGAKEVDSEAAEVDLFVYVPYEKPYALPGEEKRPQSEAFVATVAEAMAAGRRVAVADLSLVNRMDPFLAEAVLSQIALPELHGFASWNTPANAVGTVIAQLVCHRLAETSAHWTFDDRLESEKTHQAFLLARMIDDYGYQTLVRDAVRGQAEGLSPTADPLLNLFGPVGLDIRLRLVAWAEQVFATHFRGRTLCLLPHRRQVRMEQAKLEVVLPWPRVFEVEARLDLRLAPTGAPCAPGALRP